MTFHQALINLFLMLGTFFCVVATIGILRLPDVFLRIHAATKASTLGLIFLCLATALRFSQPTIIAKCLLIILFLFLTTPISAHLIARAAKKRNNPMADKTCIDEYT